MKNTGLIVACVIAFIMFAQVGMRLLAHTSSPGFDKSTLVIESPDGQSHKFNVEVAANAAQQEYGLMFRHHLADDAGMIFLFNPARVIEMWMKNTYIPLDMVFVGQDRMVMYVRENAAPQSLDIIASPGLAAAVIELKGGIAKQLNIKPGDKVECRAMEVAVSKPKAAEPAEQGNSQQP